MRLKIFMFLMAFAAGCNAPGAHFRGVEPDRVAAGGSVFEIRQRGSLVEAVRLNSRFAPRLGRIADDAKRAIEQATGCRVTRLLGDAAVITARVTC